MAELSLQDMDFNDLPWHDSELIEVVVDRENDNVRVVIRWLEDDKSYLGTLEFLNCYAFQSNMHFGIIPPDSILNAECLDHSPELDNLKRIWHKMGGDLSSLRCYRIITNSTNSVIDIFALNFKLENKKSDY